MKSIFLFGILTILFYSFTGNTTTSPLRKGPPILVIETTQGKMEAELYTIDAPKTVQHISKLANNGVYNGVGFLRIVPGILIEVVPPKVDAPDNNDRYLRGEFNMREHVEGTLGMSRMMDPNSAENQFYISLGKNPQLDTQYTVFGQVVKGLEVLRKLKVGDKMTRVYTR